MKIRPQTITEKILAEHAGKKEVIPGEFILANIDLALGNDITAPLAIKKLEELGEERVFDKEKIALVPDHFTPNKDIPSAEQCKVVREFAKKLQISHYYEVGRVGIEHALLPEEGLTLPGELIIGADSHTCTYGAVGAFSTGIGSTDLAFAMLTGKIWLRVPESVKLVFYGKLKKWVTAKDLILFTIGELGVNGANYKTLEFTGEAIRELGMDGRFTICNMVIEAGAKSGIIPPDEKTLDFVKKVNRKNRSFKIYHSDEKAEYSEIREYDAGKIEPLVAFPHLPSNVKRVRESTHIEVDQVVIGSCTNGRIEDLKIAAEIMKGKKVHPNVRLIVIPATQRIYLEALKRGWLEIFIEAGGVISPPTCGPCLGGHMGVLAKGERCLATTNRNFIGRMGHPESEVYLASPAVAAATAIKGRIAHPEEVT
ncbi:MAG TPA: 3-isopropylmalate dehydratase large subunit [bacterium]|nr:3-isopropylmalate dehydratase large subunit [bacterium]HEX68287.1 3-isopropylmalate dehydratase large subunit [bacterium]